MGNEQSVGGQAVPDTGLRLSTLCQYHAETAGNEEGMAFSWFQASTDVSGLALRGAHRWGYVLSHMGGQRLFKDSRQRFFVLLDHYMCYFDSHAPEARMKGSIDLDKARCHLELLPRPPESVDIMLQGSSNSSSSGETDEHRVEISSRTTDNNHNNNNNHENDNDDSSMVLCFSSATSLSDWMKSIFDVQQRKATFSPLRHGTGGDGGNKEDIEHGDHDDDVDSGLPGFLPRRSRYDSRNVGGGGIAGTSVRARRGTLDSPPPRPSPSHGGGEGDRGVPSSWTDGIATEECGRGIRRDRSPSPPEDPSEESLPSSSRRPRPHATSTSSAASVLLGKASERLAGLPRGGRAAGNRNGSGGGGNGNADEYGAFTTAQASIYEGWTRGLQPHGWGRMVFANGDCVEGWWEHDVLQGSGEYTSQREGWTYRGGYVAGERHGPGRLVTAQSDVWECEWTRGVVAPASRGTHATAGGELYHGGCGPCPEDPAVPCRAGQGRLRRRNGEQVDARFRAGRAVDGAKGVVRFRNGAIFFGELHDARPHGYGELYLSSVKVAGTRTRTRGGGGGTNSRKSSNRRTRKCGGSLAELDEMARDVLWYKGPFHLGKPHGSGLVKYKEPSPAAAAGGVTLRATRRVVPEVGEGEGGVSPSAPPVTGGWGETKDEDRQQRRETRESPEEGCGVGVELGGDAEGEEEEEEERAVPLAVGATDEALPQEEDDDDDDDDDDDEDDDVNTSDSDDEEEEEGDGEADGGQRAVSSGASRAVLPEGDEEKATPGVTAVRTDQRRPPVESGDGGDGGGGGADMEYEAEFICGVMVRHDPSHLRLAALRFGRAEIRRLETLLRKEEDAMSRMRAKGLCLLCNVEEMNALLVGCRHRVLCMGCAERADSCPVCGGRIGEVVKTYST